MFLTPALPDHAAGARLGGAPPRALEGHPLWDTHRYVLTLPADCAPWARGVEVSVLLRHGFDIGDDDLTYPDMAVRALVHAPSPRSTRHDLGWPGLFPAGLVEWNGHSPARPFVRVHDTPDLIQGRPEYATDVLLDGHRFLFQIDEAGWPVGGDLDEIIDEYLWGYGSVYFYGTPAPDGVVREVVAGFMDF